MICAPGLLPWADVYHTVSWVTESASFAGPLPKTTEAASYNDVSYCHGGSPKPSDLQGLGNPAQ